MISLDEVKASNSRLTSETTPRVAVFVGATAGIGQATLSQLVCSGFPVKAYIIGRDEAACQPFLRKLRHTNPAAELVFLQGQISLMAETKRLTDEILDQETHVDLLFLSAGFLPFHGRQETAEGIDQSTAVSYYSRQIFIRRLLPLLRAARTHRRDTYAPRIINILGTGYETADLDLDDLTLKEPGRLTIANYISHYGTMTSSTLKRIAEDPENKGIVTIHNHPGHVSTDLLEKSLGGKPAEGGGGFKPTATLVRSTPQEAGERSLFLSTSAKYGGKGVSMGDEVVGGLTVTGTAGESLFSVDDKLETLRIDDVLGLLERNGAADVIWEKTAEIIGGYL